MHLVVAVKRILRYIKGTLDYGILYTNHEFYPRFFSDADWAGDKETRSTTRYCCSLGSGVVSWLSKKQPIVALSTTEAEYRAAAQAVMNREGERERERGRERLMIRNIYYVRRIYSMSLET